MYEYRVIFVSTKLPEEIPWFRASRRGVVAAMSACLRKWAPSAAYRIYTISDPKTRGRDQMSRDTYLDPGDLGLVSKSVSHVWDNAALGLFGLVCGVLGMGLGCTASIPSARGKT